MHDHATTQAVFQTLLDPAADFAQSASALGLAPSEFLAIADSPVITREIDALEQLALIRARVVLAGALHTAAATLERIAAGDDRPASVVETCRKAAAQIIRLFGKRASLPPDDNDPPRSPPDAPEPPPPQLDDAPPREPCNANPDTPAAGRRALSESLREGHAAEQPSSPSGCERASLRASRECARNPALARGSRIQLLPRLPRPDGAPPAATIGSSSRPEISATSPRPHHLRHTPPRHQRRLRTVPHAHDHLRVPAPLHE